jgi:hypothetical protein
MVIDVSETITYESALHYNCNLNLCKKSFNKKESVVIMLQWV